MKLVLFRHGDKSFDGTNNPPLSEVGDEQASSIALMVKATRLPTPTTIWVSPKKRTHQTMQPLSTATQVAFEVKDGLEEKQDTETATQFRQRVKSVIEALQSLERSQPNTQIYLCSHFDWIEEFLTQLPADTDLSSHPYQHWASAQYMVLQVQEGLFIMEKFSRVELI